MEPVAVGLAGDAGLLPGGRSGGSSAADFGPDDLAQRPIGSAGTQKTFDRAFKELSNGVQTFENRSN